MTVIIALTSDTTMKGIKSNLNNFNHFNLFSDEQTPTTGKPIKNISIFFSLEARKITFFLKQ